MPCHQIPPNLSGASNTIIWKYKELAGFTVGVINELQTILSWINTNPFFASDKLSGVANVQNLNR